MLNPAYQLNDKLFIENDELFAGREGYGQALLTLGEQNNNIVVLSADLTDSTYSHLFARQFPDRFFQMGITEQNMAGVASGLAVSGKIPFMSSYAAFSPGKNWETIRTAIILNKANVKIAGHHAGIVTGEDGATHQATEDIAITRVLPGLTIYSPCDMLEAKKATIASASVTGPAYLRFSRLKTPLITTENTVRDINKAGYFFTSSHPQATLFSTGYMTYYALLAAEKLSKSNVYVDVVHISTIKPLDEKGILQAVKKTGKAFSIEDHQISGGLGSALSELFAKKYPVRMKFIGIQDTLTRTGNAHELMSLYKIDTVSIIASVKELISV